MNVFECKCAGCLSGPAVDDTVEESHPKHSKCVYPLDNYCADTDLNLLAPDFVAAIQTVNESDRVIYETVPSTDTTAPVNRRFSIYGPRRMKDEIDSKFLYNRNNIK